MAQVVVLSEKNIFGKVKDWLKGDKSSSKSSSKTSDEGSSNDEKTIKTKSISYNIKTKCDGKFQMASRIRKSKLRNEKAHDKVARGLCEANCEEITGKNLVPGNLLLFEYLHPIHEEELPYWDASPCTIFFGVFKVKGKVRVIGFNIHYYPHRLRRIMLDGIFEKFRSFYEANFTKINNAAINKFNYQEIVTALKQDGLSFGIREYDPLLMRKVRAIPANGWEIASYTEGWFQKAAQNEIMNIWKRKRLHDTFSKVAKSFANLGRKK